MHLMEIKNTDIKSAIEKDFAQFKLSATTIESFFNCDILIAKKWKTSEFHLERRNLKYDRIIIHFANGYKHDNLFFGGKDYNLLVAKQPLRIKMSALATLFKLPVNDPDFDGFQIHLLNTNEETQLAIDKSKIQIAVFGDSWPSNEIYWLPSPNLLKNKHICSVPNCCFTARTKSCIKRHELNCFR